MILKQILKYFQFLKLMMKNKITLLLAILIFMGCKNNSNTPDIGKALSEVTTQFPQLPKGGIEHYLFEKSVKNAKYNFEIQLYSEADTIADPQKIMILINAKKECYAIPFFSNTYRDYWGFKHEIPLPKIQKVQSTFSKQYFNALYTLKLNKIDVCMSVTNDMLISILDCDKITNCNFLDVKKTIFANNNISLDTESNYEHLKEKWAKNDEEILKTSNSGIGSHNLLGIIGYLDCKNFRFHQVVIDNNVMDVNKNPQKNITSERELQIKSYRKDQIIHMMGSPF